MYRINHFFILILITALLAGCEKKAEETVQSPSETFEVQQEEAKAVFVDTAKPVLTLSDMSMYYVQDYTPALYEPADGCYVGAYILANRMLNFDMLKFEEITEKEHSQYVYNYKLGEEFPVDWLMSCIANHKTPYIVVWPPNDYFPLDENLLTQAAMDFGEFYVPIFVSFYPNPAGMNVDAEAYKAFFIKARSAFQSLASNTAFVWSIDAKEAYSSNDFYPGDSFVDWVGLSVTKNIYEKGVLNDWDMWGNIDYFYNSYQQKKPIMVTALAISHYSSFDHKYRTQIAVDEIKYTYQRLQEKYPRIKAVQYMDFNHVLLTSGDGVKDNYTISDNDEILAQYKDVIKDSYFLSELTIGNGKQRKEKMSSAFPLLEEGEQLFISENALIYELGVNNPAIDSTHQRTKDGIHYYDLERTAQMLNIVIEKTENSLILAFDMEDE